MVDPTQTTKPRAGDLVRITKDRGFGAKIGAVGRIRAGNDPDPCPYCDGECNEWPNIDMLDGTYVYHIPECAMEIVPDV